MAAIVDAVVIDDPLAGAAGSARSRQRPPARRSRPRATARIYIADLCSERAMAIPDVKTRSEASDLITKLKSTPRFPQGVTIEHVEADGLGGDGGTHGYWQLRLGAEGGTEIPVGKYALENAPTNTENDISSWSAWVNDAGTGLAAQASRRPDLENVPQSAILPILRRIGDDPEAAMALYGHHIGQCGACGRRLTNELVQATRHRPDLPLDAGLVVTYAPEGFIVRAT